MQYDVNLKQIEVFIYINKFNVYIGEKGVSQKFEFFLYYKGVFFYRVVKDFMIQFGDFIKGKVMYLSYRQGFLWVYVYVLKYLF